MKSKIAILSSAICIVTQLALADSATWNADPTTAQWNNPTNWTPATVPNGHHDTATFEVSNTTEILISHHTGLEAIVFNPGASSYTIATNRDLNLEGDGVVNNSGVQQNFVILSIVGKMHFRNSASAGENVHYSVRAGAGETTELSFYDTATAGGAIINNHGGDLPGATLFFDSSTAGHATITCHAGNSNGAACTFMDNSDAGTGTFFFIGEGSGNTGPQFRDSSSAGQGTFTVDAGNYFDLLESSRADRATVIINGGAVMSCVGSSHAENATIIANSPGRAGRGGAIYFAEESHGDRARVVLAPGGILDISSHIAPGVSLGSFEGKGRVILGANDLAVGATNLDATFSGLIEDGTSAGGSLTKTGANALGLDGPNTYTGGTVVNEGTLSARNTVGSATGSGDVSVQGGRLTGDGIIAGVVTVGSGTGVTATLSPGRIPGAAGTLTVQNNVVLNSDATYQLNLQSDAGTASSLSANGMMISAGASFAVRDTANATLTPGTSVVAIDNTSATVISGVFANLSDGGTITVGNNTFQANYEGGDGNDLTLTVIP